jgi:hypothetical protein
VTAAGSIRSLATPAATLTFLAKVTFGAKLALSTATTPPNFPSSDAKSPWRMLVCFPVLGRGSRDSEKEH